MAPSRRQLLCAGSSALLALPGCTDRFAPSSSIGVVETELRNGDTAPRVFHVAIETARGLGEWHSRRVPAGTAEPTTTEPPDAGEPVAVHGVVDNRPVRVEFARVDLDGNVCPRLHFYYRVMDDPEVALLETTEFTCRRTRSSPHPSRTDDRRSKPTDRRSTAPEEHGSRS